ncbi:MAG: cupredoxin domain-containing protein [Gaiellales bacterium]
MRWKLTLAALVALAAAVAPATAGPSHQAKAATVTFRMVEWDILPLTATKTGATRVTFVVRNAGKMTHEFVVLKTTKAAGRLAARSAREAPETGAVGEIEEIKPGEVKRLTLNLRKGHYSLICNLPFHYGRGQFVDFYVR